MTKIDGVSLLEAAGVLAGFKYDALGSVVLVLAGLFSITASTTKLKREAPDWIVMRKWLSSEGLPVIVHRILGVVMMGVGVVGLMPNVVRLGKWGGYVQFLSLLAIIIGLVLKGIAGGNDNNVVSDTQGLW